MNKNKIALICVILSGIIFNLFACGKPKEEEKKPAPAQETAQMEEHKETPVKSTNQAPDFTLKDLNDNDFSLSSHWGKVIILDFWATYCPPCKKEIPDFINLYNSYKDKGLVIIGVALDNGGKGIVKPFADNYKINYPILIGTEEVSELYGGIRAITTTFIINKQREIVQTFIGFRDKETFENEIKKLL